MSKDFIGVYENAIPDDLCDKVIEDFCHYDSLGMTVSRQQNTSNSRHIMDDKQVFLGQTFDAKHMHSFGDIENLLWANAYEKYKQEYSVLQDLGPHNNYNIKIQKTEPSQGYHVWHCEASGRHHANRLIAWIVYLNDVEDGGETEFLYQRKRVEPKKGTVVLFPAAYTHTHRGNPPLSGTKYIATGWMEF